MTEPHQRLRKLGAGEHVSKRSSGQPRCDGRLNQVIGMEDGLWVTINQVNQCEERQWEKQHGQDASEPIKDIPQSSSHCPSSQIAAVTQRGLRIRFTSDRYPLAAKLRPPPCQFSVIRALYQSAGHVHISARSP